VAIAASLEAGRRKGTERGDSIKRGCRASLRVVQPHNSDLAQVRVPEDGRNALLEHTNEAGMRLPWSWMRTGRQVSSAVLMIKHRVFYDHHSQICTAMEGMNSIALTFT